MSASERCPCRFIQVVGLLAACLTGGQALGQTLPTVSDADIERIRREQPTITESDIEAARQKYRMPSDTELRSAPVPGQPNIEALPSPVSRTPIDLEALARSYAAPAAAMAQASGLAAGPGLLVFVSLSMPQPTLQRLVDQAARAKATLILRGFAGGSLRDTVSRVQTLIGDRHVSVQIDPQAFDRFAVTQVPTFVLIRDGTRPLSCASGSCAPPQLYLRTMGDVSLDYALEFMQRAAPRFAQDAAGFLRRLRG